MQRRLTSLEDTPSSHQSGSVSLVNLRCISTPPTVEMQRVLSKLHLLFDNIVSAANFALPESTGQTALGGSLEAAAAAGLTQ
jgi:hypothetical protein